MNKKKYFYIFCFFITFFLAIFAFNYFFKETPSRAVEESINSILNKDYNLFLERVDLPVVTNNIYSQIFSEKKYQDDTDDDIFRENLKKTFESIRKKILIFFSSSNKEEISDLIKDYLLRDSIPNSSLFDKTVFFEFLDNIEKSSISVKLIEKQENIFKIKVSFFQKTIQQKLGVNIVYQKQNGTWKVVEIDQVPLLISMYTSKRESMLFKNFKEQQFLLNKYILVEKIRIESNSNIVDSFFKIKVRIKNIGKEDIYSYALKVGFENEFGKLDPSYTIKQNKSFSPGEFHDIGITPEANFFKFKVASSQNKQIGFEIIYISLENEVLKAYEEKE